MPPRGKGPRLWYREARVEASGAVRAGRYFIKDGGRCESTGCGAEDRDGAERALAAYIDRKHLDDAAHGARRPDQVPLADAVALYCQNVVDQRSRPREARARLEAILRGLGHLTLGELTGAVCRDYAKSRSSLSSARRELEDLRAAIRHMHAEGALTMEVKVILPEKRPARERWLTRDEAAALIWTAYRAREVQEGEPTARRPWGHVARFLLVALYTGTRASPIAGAALGPAPKRPWVDLNTGVFYRKPAGTRETKKRAPPVQVPERLLAHLRRWRRLGAGSVVEWNGEPVTRINKAFRAVVAAAGMDPKEVTPHTCRHTAATWLMQAGVDPVTAGRYLGMSPETLFRVYGHASPTALAEARAAFDKPVRATVRPLKQAKNAERKRNAKARQPLKSQGKSKAGRSQ